MAKNRGCKNTGCDLGLAFDVQNTDLMARDLLNLQFQCALRSVCFLWVGYSVVSSVKFDILVVASYSRRATVQVKCLYVGCALFVISTRDVPNSSINKQ